MGEGGGGEEKESSALSLFRFHLSPFPQKRLILRLRQQSYTAFCYVEGMLWFKFYFPLF